MNKMEWEGEGGAGGGVGGGAKIGEIGKLVRGIKNKLLVHTKTRHRQAPYNYLVFPFKPQYCTPVQYILELYKDVYYSVQIHSNHSESFKNLERCSLRVRRSSLILLCVGRLVATQRGLNTKRPTLVFFLGPTKPLQSYG